MTEPVDILRQAIQSQISDMHTCMPAKITEYSHETQKAKVKPTLIKRYKDKTLQELPEITNVPVIFPRSKNFSMHWPLSSGDPVMLLFSERSLDQWLNTGKEGAPLDTRKFDLSDAIAIPGLYSFAEPSPAPDNDNFYIEMGKSKLKLSSDGKICFKGLTEELMSLLNDLFSEIQGITVDTPQGPGFISVASKASISVLQSKFNTLKGSF